MPWEVHSYHLNIGVGDAAVHLLVDVDLNTGTKNIVEAVLVDGGTGAAAGRAIKGFCDAIGNRVLQAYQQDGAQIVNLALTAIVITHWDDDHYSGILEMFKEDIERALRVLDNDPVRPQTSEIAMRWAQGGAVRSPYLKYVRTRQNDPLYKNRERWDVNTIIYVPYWRNAAATVPNASERPQDWDKHMNIPGPGNHLAVCFSGHKFQMRMAGGQVVKTAVDIPLFKRGPDSELMPGMDFFRGENAYDLAVNALSPEAVSLGLFNRQGPYGNTKPAMFCVMANQRIVGHGERAARANLKWRWDQNDMLNMRLSRSNNGTGLPDDTRAMSIQRSGEIHANFAFPKNEPTNNTSIACMVIWPNANQAQVSHYFGGDLPEELEEEVLKWSTVPNPQQPGQRDSIMINSVKMSHHGAASSTPNRMLLVWRPRNLVVSNGDLFSHPTWVALLYLYSWHAWMGRNVLLFTFPNIFITNYPAYLGSRDPGANGLINYIHPLGSASLWLQQQDNSSNYRAAIAGMWATGPPGGNPFGPPPAANVAKDLICAFLIRTWDTFSAVPARNYFHWNQNVAAITDASLQSVRAFSIKQMNNNLGFTTTFSEIIYSDTWPNAVWTLSNLTPRIASTSERYIPQKPVNDKTKANPTSESLLANPVGAVMGERAFKLLKNLNEANTHEESVVDNSNESQADLVLKPDEIRHKRNGSSVDDGWTLVDDLVYLTASDATISGTIYQVKGVKGSSLDRMLGRLRTAALVFLSLADTPAWESLDESDELVQWLISILGGTVANGLRLTANASRTELLAFELQFPFVGVYSDLSKTPPTGRLDLNLIFNSANNADAFPFPPRKNIHPPWIQSGVIGPGQFILMSLESSTDVEPSINFADLCSMFDVELPTAARILSNAMDLKFSLDRRPKKKNAIWFFSDSSYTTTLRLQFQPLANDSKVFADKLNKMIAYLSPGTTVVLDDPRVVAKKTWKRKPYDYLRVPAKVETSFAIVVQANIKPTSIKSGLDLEIACIIEKSRTKWIITFSPEQTLNDLITFVIAMLPGVSHVQLPSDILPIESDAVKLRRITIVTEDNAERNASSTVVALFFQVTLGSMTLICSLTLPLASVGEFSFSGSLFSENRWENLGPIDDSLNSTFSFLPYMPDGETWTTLEVISDTGEKVRDVGDLAGLYSVANNKEVLAPGPVDFNLLKMQFYLSKSTLSFSALVVSPSAEAKNYKVPIIQLNAATLDFVFAKGHGVQNFEVTTRFELTTGRPGLDEPVMYLNLSLRYAKSTWTLHGNANGLTGDYLYKLFNDDCNAEMTQLLSHLRINLDLTYNYILSEDKSSAVGSSFIANGVVGIGPFDLALQYKHEGSSWTFYASLSEYSKTGNLIDIIHSFCGNVPELLPGCLRNVELTPKVSNDKITYLRVAKSKDFPDFLVVVFKLALSDGTSIMFYQIQEKSLDRKKITKPKRLLLFKVSQLPQLPDVPVIGAIPQPFDEMDFMWLPGDSDLTYKELLVFQACLSQDEVSIPYQNVKKVWKDDDPVLKTGFHFMVSTGQKVLLDYAFGGQKGEKDPKALKGEMNILDAPTTTPINKTFGSLTITGIGLSFDLEKEEMAIVMDASLQLGPLQLSAIGLGLSINLKGKTFKSIAMEDVNVLVRGLGAGFENPPIQLAGLLMRGEDEKTRTKYYQGGAVVGVTPYSFTAAGYYGKSKTNLMETFFTYCRLNGPLMTVGFAEISGITGGFGYNSTISFPDVTTVVKFPFIAPPDPANKTMLDTLNALYDGGWFSPKEGSYWAAAGLSVLAFEVLQVNAVVVLEMAASVKLGIFGVATAEMPKDPKIKKKFAKVQLGVIAVLDFTAGVLKVEGQLTPASFVLDPSCHLTGGFALYSWFGGDTPETRAMQGNWVFTIGGYHPAYKPPTQYPVPPRLGISWSFDDSINITGRAYFAVTPMCAMGGGSLRVTLNLGALGAWFDAYADFLINYRPFFFQAEGGVSVGVRFTLDLWLVSLPISIEIGARLYLQGPPITGRVHVDFWVFGFDVNFGTPSFVDTKAIDIDEFIALVLQADSKAQPSPQLFLSQGSDVAADDNNVLAPHIFSCQSGLMTPVEGKKDSDPNNDPWVVRGAIFTFVISCKFALSGATVNTGKLDGGDTDLDDTYPVPKDDTPDIFSKPMKLEQKMVKSHLTVTIRPEKPSPKEIGELDDKPLNPSWKKAEAIYSSLPKALWGQYNKSNDPSIPNSHNEDSLTNHETAVRLMTGLTIHAPGNELSDDKIAKFNVKISMGVTEACRVVPKSINADGSWDPDPVGDKPWDAVANAWGASETKAEEAVNAWSNILWGGRKCLTGSVPKKLVEGVYDLYLQAPRLGVAS